MLRPRSETRRLKVAPRKAKLFAEINSGILYTKIIKFLSGLKVRGVFFQDSRRGVN